MSLFKRLWAKTLPFVTRSPEIKVSWLDGVIRKNVLTDDEIMPYVRLLLSEYEESSNNVGPDQGEAGETFARLFAALDAKVLLKLVECTDIYDVPMLLPLLPELTLEQAVVILLKAPPPYEKKPDLLLARIYQAMWDSSGTILEKAATQVKQDGSGHLQFEAAYERFREILDDEQFLKSLFPKAKV